MLNVITSWINVNQNNTEILPNTYQNGIFQKTINKKMLARMWRKGNLYTLLIAATVEK